jgi:hypothetical protein
MSYATPWPRVYPGLPLLAVKNEVKRLTIELPMSDANAIMAVACNPAIFSLICQTALKETVTYINQHGLTYEQSTALVNFVCKRPVSGTHQTPGTSDESGRTEGIHDGAKDASEVATGVRKKVKRGSGGKGGVSGDVV